MAIKYMDTVAYGYRVRAHFAMTNAAIGEKWLKLENKSLVCFY